MAPRVIDFATCARHISTMSTAFMALHGFGSSPGSKKNLAFHEAFLGRGLVLERPDLNQPSFATLSFAAMLAELDRLDRARAPTRWSIVGSSLGGYVAALWAAAHPERVERMVLLCPAFELGRRTTTLVMPDELADWQKHGTHPFENARGERVPLHYRFREEALRIDPMPSPPGPIRVIHGVHDVRVPVETSRRFVAMAPTRRSLIEVDDGHELLADLPRLCRDVLDFLLDR